MKAALADLRRGVLHDVVRAWFTLLLALFVVTATTIGGVMAFLSFPYAGITLQRLANFGGFLAVGLIYAVFLAPLFSLLALPFLPFQRWIVGVRPPFLRPGYVAVALYGPALLFLVTRDWTPEGFVAAAGFYEVIALAATLLFVQLADALGFQLAGQPTMPAIEARTRP